MEKNNSKSSAYLWNTVSSMLNAGASAILLLVVNRACGTIVAGDFTLAFSIAQLMVTIGYFELRSYQVTDVTDRHTQSEYFTFKVLSCVAMLFISAIYVFINGYSFVRVELILALCVFKMLDAYEEFFVTVLQRYNRLGTGAKISSVRQCISLVVFSALVILFKDVIFAVCVCVVVSIVIIYFGLQRNVNRQYHISLHFDFAAIKEILVECLPLFIGSYLILYVGNAPKYAIDQYMSESYQTYYAILFMPSFVINLLSGFVFKPLLTDMSTYYYTDQEKYKRIIQKIGAALTGIFVLVLLVALWLGIPVLNWLYGVQLDAYQFEFILMIIGGAMSALGVIISYMITIMRCQKWLMVSYIITAAAAYLLSPLLVSKAGIRGASIGFLLFSAIRTIFYLLTLWICQRNQARTESSSL